MGLPIPPSGFVSSPQASAAQKAQGYLFISITTLVNVYIHGDNKRYKDALNHLICHPYPILHPIIIAGDFNTHHPSWALEGSKWVNEHPNPNARLLKNWMSESNFHLFNDLNIPTRNGKKDQSDSIIDLTLLNSAAVDGFPRFGWSCESEGAMGSDHNIISWAIAPHDQSILEKVEDLAPNFVIDPELQEEWTASFKRHMEAATLAPDPKAADELDAVANGILDAMAAATKEVMPMKKPRKRGKRSPWWNEECSRALRELKTPSNTRSREARRATLRGAIRRAQRSHADRLCQNVTSGNVFRYTNWYKGKWRSSAKNVGCNN
ncbi:hypothetical protein RSOLAG1IB_11585 [Rhizoctonia solani AG-1 IB]|uniref:Endonuclease/exonuclease/phosphatase domain-containing protein n=1 Tax=Thanatephorus cucumeris (strain AG1-IB / isolate 7/3/14) TaxID=1108050 RepID=A0A0B7FD95_THACB|nr:hypothetical protein RSOLAG1IB_11585 [Rhizoctonia solani AG-1 IB]